MTDNIYPQSGSVSRQEREAITGGPGATLWLTGLPASGKSTIAFAAEERLNQLGRSSYVLDGDNLRSGVNSDLGFEKSSRFENVRRAGEIARLMADAGMVVLVGLVSPYREGRDEVRLLHDQSKLAFVEVHVATSLETCRSRDPKGLYTRAEAGEVLGLTGVDAPYEPPLAAEVTIADGEPLESAVLKILDQVPGLQLGPNAQSTGR